MNERIQELYIKTLSEECSNPALVDIEKFAELIVRECRDMFVVDSVSWNLLNEKLEHFGVED